MQPDLWFDVYPYDDPKAGARLVRLTKSELLAGSFFRVERRGTGSGKIVLNSRQAAFTAANLHEENLVEVGDANVSATDPLGGFFLHRGDFDIISADEAGGENFGIGGPGLLAYLAREIMWSHTYFSGDLDPTLGSVYGQDPFDDLWRLSAAGTGSTLGAMLWRAVYEASHYRTGAYTHEHGDGLAYTDTHVDDRLSNALTDLVVDFTRDLDSDGNAWNAYDGAFSARVKQQLLSVVLDLVGKGMDVQMRLGRQLTLSAYNSYGRDLRGAAFGAGVVRFEHAVNIANPARRAIEAGLNASRALVGSNDTYAAVSSPVGSHVTRSVGLDSDAEDPGALAIDGEANLRAREAGSDVPALKVLYGDNEAAGRYLFAPPEVGGHAWVGDLVTIHRGAGAFEWNEADERIEAIQFDLVEGKVWDDPTIEFGALYRSIEERGRAAAIQAIAAKPHGPHIHLCPPGRHVDPTVVDGNFAGGTNPGGISVPAGTNMMLLVHVIGTVTDPDDPSPLSATCDGVAMTPVPGSYVVQTTATESFAQYVCTEWFYAPVTPGDRFVAFVGGYWGWLRAIDANIADPVDAASVVTNMGDSINPNVTAGGTLGLPIAGFGGFGGINVDAPTMDAPGALEWGVNEATGTGPVDFGAGHGDASASFQTKSYAKRWVASAFRLKGLGTDGCTPTGGPNAHGGDPTAPCGKCAARGNHDHDSVDNGDAAGGELAGTYPNPTVAAMHSGSAHHAENHASRHASGGADAVKLDDLAAPDDNTDLNVSTTRHGLAPKLPNDATKYFDGTGAYSVPPGGSSLTIEEEDGGPTGTPGTLKVTNGRLTDNGDGSFSLAIPSPTGGTITIEEVDGAPSGAFDKLILPNGTLTDNGDGSATYTPAPGGGGVTRSSLGTTSIGPTWTALNTNKWYAKPILIPTGGCYLGPIKLYVRRNSGAANGLIEFSVWDDSGSGTPDHMIAYWPTGPASLVLLGGGGENPGDGRWFTAGGSYGNVDDADHTTLWIAVRTPTAGHEVATDTGSDRSHGNAAGQTGVDWPFTNGSWAADADSGLDVSMYVDSLA